MSAEDKNAAYAHSVGELLRITREAKNLTLSDVQQSTRMSLPVLKALEQDDFASFESETYLKGFLKSYARYLGLDPEELSRRVDGQRGSEPSAAGTMWDYEQEVKEEKLKSPRILSRVVLPLMLLVIVLLSILLVIERRKVQELRSNLRQFGQTEEVADTRRA